MTGPEALEVAQHVTVNGKQLVVLDAEAWEGMIEWLEAVEDVQAAQKASAQLSRAWGLRHALPQARAASPVFRRRYYIAGSVSSWAIISSISRDHAWRHCRFVDSSSHEPSMPFSTKRLKSWGEKPM